MTVLIDVCAILFSAEWSSTLSNIRVCSISRLLRILHRFVLLHAFWCQLFFGKDTVHLGYISNISIELLTSWHSLDFELACHCILMTFIAAHDSILAHRA